MSVKLLGAQALIDAFRDLAKVATSPTIHKNAIEAARVVHERIQSEAPVRTGRLRESIEFGGFKQRAGKPVAAFVRANLKKAVDSRGRPYAPFVEFGTPSRAPNPFFTRGWNKSKDDAERIVAEGVGQAVDEVLK